MESTGYVGYVRLYRKILDNPIAQRPQYAWLFTVLILSANHKENKIMWNGKVIIIKAGQFITGRKALSKQTGIPESTVEDILKFLESQHQIQQHKTTKFRLITVIEWEKYQHSDSNPNNKATTKQQQADTNKNDKNEEKEEAKNKNFSRSLEELQANTGGLLNKETGLPENSGRSPLEVKEEKRLQARLAGFYEHTFGSKVIRLVKHFCALYLEKYGHPYGKIVKVDVVAKNISTYFKEGETEKSLIEMLNAYFASEKADSLPVKLTTAFSDDTYRGWTQGKLGGEKKEDKNSILKSWGV